MFTSLWLFNKSITNMMTITFAALILVEILNIYTLVNRFNWPMRIASFSTVSLFLFSEFKFESWLGISEMTDFRITKVVFITLAAWLPAHMLKIFSIYINPPKRKRLLSEQPEFTS